MESAPSTSLSGRLTRLPEWLRSVNPWIIDATLTLVFVIIGLVSTAGRGGYAVGEVKSRNALSVILVLAITLPYVFRRRAPLAVLIVSSTALAALVLVPYNEGGTPTVVWCGTYAVGAWCSARRGTIGLAYITAVLLVVWASNAPRFGPGTFAVNLAVFAAAFFFGTSIRSRRQRLEALEDRAVALESEHAEKQARVLADERLRIAHELHDVIAHSMGVIAVQAGVGAHVIDTQPAEAKKALAAISDLSRSTLGEIRRIVAALRQDGDETMHAPAPTLGDLDRLVAEVRGAGLDVEVTSDEVTEPLPHGVELAAFRIVQEALTNVLKHAGPARATVCIEHRPGALHLRISDDGRGFNARSTDGGHGLVGMRERVAAYGGTFSAGPVTGGGFQVNASLPYGGDE